jgi:tetratricopeptide (TPR) repeat protein
MLMLKACSLIFKPTVSAIFVVLALVSGLALAAFNFSETAATDLLATIVAAPTQSPGQELRQLQQALDQAKTAGNRTAMINNLIRMRAIAPHDEQISSQLAQLYYQQGLDWRDANRFDSARQSFEWALSVQPNLAESELEQQLIDLYLAGIDHYQAAEWAKAVVIFEQIYRQNPAYLSVDEILYSAYYNLGVIQEAAQELTPALDSYQQAVAILPNAPEANQKVEQVKLKLNPPTPDPTPEPVVKKHVVVDISDQRTYLYENDVLATEFIVSTGEPGRDTAIGDFKIQSKIPMAYASIWNLDMPFWLGIYYSGPLENGFHAVPTVRDTGVTMWDGYLGQRVSYGCVILSMEDAETLYNWSDMDIPVSIVP